MTVGIEGSKIRYLLPLPLPLPLHPATAASIDDYLQAAGHHGAKEAPLFRPIKDGHRARSGSVHPLTPDGVYKMLRACARAARLDAGIFGPHSLRATAATNALDHTADIAKVQEWLGHANIATTRIYDRRRSRPEDSPTFKVAY